MANDTTPPARYGGLRGTFLYGLMLLSFFTVLALLAGGVILWMTGSFRAVQVVATRVFLVGLVGAGSATLARAICHGSAEQFLTRRLVAGDLAVVGGFFSGLLLPGYLIVHLGLFGNPQGRAVGVGQPVEISGPTLDGGHFDLAEHRGRVVLVDFWATWCRPCVAELPHILETYEKYHDQGLDVVSVSLDYQQSALAQFVEANKIPWPQIYYPGEENPLASRYQVNSIPFLMVIDRDGKVAELDVRGREIETAVARALGVGASPSGSAAGIAQRLVHLMMYSVLAAPPWLFLACGWGGAIVLALCEAVLRRAFRRPNVSAG